MKKKELPINKKEKMEYEDFIFTSEKKPIKPEPSSIGLFFKACSYMVLTILVVGFIYLLIFTDVAGYMGINIGIGLMLAAGLYALGTIFS